MNTVRFITILIIMSSIGFYSYSKFKDKPSPSICYAAYDYWEADILVKYLYKDLAIARYKKYGGKYYSELKGKLSLLSEKSTYASRNEIWKVSDFISCHISFNGSEYQKIERQVKD